VKGWWGIALGLVLAAGLILVSERSSPAVRIAPVGALGAPGGLGGYAAASGDRDPLAPPLSQPAPAAPTLTPAPPQGFAQAAPGQRTYIPIMMYHYVRHVDSAADPLGFNLSVTPEQLAAQLDWLKSAGYETLRMDAAAACIRGEGPCPARAVVLTFDDGYMDAYTTALPLLQQRGYVATFYIVSGFVGQPGYMSWNEVRALRDAGMEIGAHTVSHPDLTTLGLDDIRAQVAQSGAAISAEIGLPVLSFCYPGGRYNETVAAIARESGFTSATTTNPDGPQGDPFTLPRVRISGDLTLEGFQWSVSALLP
jgi:peptidoglycan/xylan/chitin deacetylase (PgdA/CDA1 family)